ncbi:MAG TPA: DUF5420 family protein [Rhodocyclaceae bacterium]|nr:DUF5420 family protein [Rhodocyclaceae bacterium]
MSEVTMRYFVAEGEKAERVIEEGLKKVNAVRKVRADFMNKHGASGTWEYRHGNPYGLCFDSDKCDGATKPGFLKPEKHTQEGVTYYAYKFDKRTNIGKELIKEAAGLATFDFSTFAVCEYGIYRSLIGAHKNSRTGMAMYQSAAGISKGKLVFSIPEGGEERKEDLPPIPSEFRELKKSEFIALTQE